MRLKPKFGIIGLLDALGARTMSIQSSAEYLNKTDALKREIEETLKITLDEEDGFSASGLFDNLKPRFFGDSILMTYEVRDEELLHEYLERFLFILNCFIPAAMDLEILFRGALSIGQYLEKRNVALGPAVTDAANWYERTDFIGVVATPAASHYIKAALVETDAMDTADCPLSRYLVMYDVPLSGGGTLRTYALNWPDALSAIHCGNDEQATLPWFYERVKKFPVPPGTETKYANTEAFIRHGIALALSEKNERRGRHDVAADS